MSESLCIGVAIVAYAALALLTLRLKDAEPTALDRWVQRIVLAIRWKHRRRAGVIGSVPGYPGFYFAVVALLIWFLRAHDARGITSLAFASVIGWATHRIIKLFAKRQRPDSRKGHSHYPEAFPSGHTIATTAIALAAGYIFTAQGFIWPAVGWIIAIGLPIVVGKSRVIADEHWTTDVLGGLTGGIATAAIAILLFLRGAR